MDGRAGLRLDDVDPAFRSSSYDVVAKCREDSHAGRVLRILGSLFSSCSWVDVFGCAEGCGGENSFNGRWTGDIYKDGLVLEERGDEEKTVLLARIRVVLGLGVILVEWV